MTDGAVVLTIEEVAQFLKVSETTLYQLVRAGKIPSRKVGREWRFLKQTIIDWLAKPAEGEDVEDVVQLDKFGGEFMIEDGQEKVALWLPITLEEKEKLLAIATSKGKTVSSMVVGYLKEVIANT
jgi:excisionase family DNA binding protein